MSSITTTDSTESGCYWKYSHNLSMVLKLLQGITSYLSWLWSNLLMYLPRKPFSPMSNGFERSCRKNYVIILCFFAKNPYLKTNGACHLILLRIQNKTPWAILTWFFYIIVQKMILDFGLFCYEIKHKINYLIPKEWYHLLNIMKLETQRLQPTYSPPQNLKWLISRNSFFHFLLLRKWNSTPDKKNRKFKKNTLLYYMLYQVSHQSC